MDDRLAGLVRAVDKFVAESKRVGSFVVLLGENSEANRTKLADFAKASKLATPLTVPLDGQPPASYNLNPKARVTVLVNRRKTVKANFALADSPTEQDIEAIIKAAKEVAGGN